jgi:hypothetical protein
MLSVRQAYDLMKALALCRIWMAVPTAPADPVPGVWI